MRIESRIRGLDATRVLVALGVFATVALRNWSPIVYGAQYLMVFAIFLHLARRRMKFQAGIYVAFYGFFAMWCLLSTLWARETERSLSGTIGVFQFVLISATVAAYVIAEREPEFLMDCLAWSVVGLVLVLIILTPIDVWREAIAPVADASSAANRLGHTVSYHPNALGRIASIGAFIWIYKFRSNRTHRLLNLLMIFGLVAVLLLTKSRLSIALFVVLVLLYLLFTSPNLGKLTMRLILGGAGLGLVYWAVLHIPVLYNTVGFRFTAMLGATGAVDASTSTRAEMVDIAFDLFSQNPIFGVGFQNFSYYYYHEYSGWAETYAHNNYSELLADLGLVGIISYYSIPLWVAYWFFRRFRTSERAGRTLSSFLFLLAASQLAADFASISFTSDFVQLVTALLFSWMILEDRRNRALVRRLPLGTARGSRYPGDPHRPSRRQSGIYRDLVLKRMRQPNGASVH